MKSAIPKALPNERFAKNLLVNGLKVRKKKKNISIFKKRILLERLKKQIELKNEAAIADLANFKFDLNSGQNANSYIADAATFHSIDIDVVSSNNINDIQIENNGTEKRDEKSSFAIPFNVYVFEFITDSDWMLDEDEVEEIKENIKSLVASYKSVKQIKIWSYSRHPEDRVFIQIEFNDCDEAYIAAKSIDGLVFSGITIKTILTNDIEKAKQYLAMLGAYHSNVASNQISKNEKSFHSKGTISNKAIVNEDGMIIMQLHNLIHASDGEDDAEREETFHDVSELCSSFGMIQNIEIKSYDDNPIDSTASNDQIMFRNQMDLLDHIRSDPWIVLQMNDVSTAIQLILKLNGKIIAENRLELFLYDFHQSIEMSFHEKYLIPIASDGMDGVLYGIRLEEIMSIQLGLSDKVKHFHNLLGLFTRHASDFRSKLLYKVVFISRDDDTRRIPYVLSPSQQVICEMYQDLISNQTKYSATELMCLSIRHPSPSTKWDVWTDGTILPINHVDRISTVASNRSHPQMSSSSCVVVIKNFLSSLDVLDLEAVHDPSEKNQWKRDLLSLFQQVEESKLVLLVESLFVLDVQSNSLEKRRIDVSEDAKVALIEFETLDEAMDAMFHLDGSVISGSTVVATLKFGQHVLDGKVQSLSVRKASDVDKSSVMLDESKVLMLNSSSNIANSGSRGSASSSSSTAPEEDELICLVSMDFNQKLTTYSVCNEVSNDVQSSDEAKIISKYKVAQSAPKFPFHTEPKESIPVANEEMNALIKEFLSLMATFQARVKEKTPLKYKQKLRFVCGMKQTLNAIKAQKVKLLCLAVNTEACETIDEKIDTIISEARIHEVPIIYCLSKRQLGKALHLSMKQSVVAVYDPDGAYDKFRMIMSYIKKPVNRH